MEASKTAIKNAVVVELGPLDPDDVTNYLKVSTPTGEASRWQDLFKFLRRPGGKPLAKVLSSPLMLWLAREIYGHEADPGELTDTSRFGDREAIEYHLLDEFIPREFAEAKAVPSHWARRAKSWLSFLAAELDKTGSRDIAWWRFPSMAPGGRPVTFALRGVLLVAAAWYAAAWALHRLGGRRGVTDPAVLLRGPLGRHLVPAWIYVHAQVPAGNNDLSAAANLVMGFIPHSLLLVELLVVPFALAVGAFHALAEIVRPGGATGYHVCRTRVRLRGVLFAAGFVLGMTVFTAFLLGAIVATAVAPDRTGRFIDPLFHMASAGVLLVVIFLWVLTWVLDPLTTERIDITQLPAPDEGLRLSRRHTRLLLLLERTSRLILAWLVFGPVIAAAYGSYEIVAVSCRITLGGRESASDAFDDARLWLACTRRMPWRVMKFLRTAKRLGILRPAGSVYQFRHVRLQQRLAMQHVQWSRRMEAAATPLIRWWQTHPRWPGNTWRPGSAAPWTLPIWTFLFAEYADFARTSAMRVALGRADGNADHVGPGVAQHFGGAEGGLPWVQCWIPGHRPSLVADPVWQALASAGTRALQDIGREGSVSALTAVGFPVDKVAKSDATRIELSGGSLGDGALLRQDGQETWCWAPERSFDSVRLVDARSSPAKLWLRMETTVGWAVSRLQIEDQRYRALPGILEGSDLTCAIADLSAQPLSGIRWEERERDRRDRSLVTFIGGSANGPSWSTVHIRLFRQRHVTCVAASSYLTIGDLPAWQSVSIRNSCDGVLASTGAAGCDTLARGA